MNWGLFGYGGQASPQFPFGGMREAPAFAERAWMPRGHGRLWQMYQQAQNPGYAAPEPGAPQMPNSGYRPPEQHAPPMGYRPPEPGAPRQMPDVPTPWTGRPMNPPFKGGPY